MSLCNCPWYSCKMIDHPGHICQDRLISENNKPKPMSSERIKKIQSETACPDSISVQQALNKVWNECEQERNDKVERLREAAQYVLNTWDSGDGTEDVKIQFEKLRKALNFFHDED